MIKTTLGVVSVTGDLVEEQYEGEVILEVKKKSQVVLMKRGMFLKLNHGPKSGDPLFRLWDIPEIIDVDRSINTIAEMLTRLLDNKKMPFVTVNAIATVIDNDVSLRSEHFNTFLDILTIKPEIPIGVLLIDETTGELMSLFDIAIKTEMLQKTIYQISSPDYKYKLTLKKYIETCFPFESNSAICSQVGDVLVGFLRRKILSKLKKGLYYSFVLMLKTFRYKSEEQRESRMAFLLFRKKYDTYPQSHMKRFFKIYTEDFMKIVHNYYKNLPSPKKELIDTWNLIKKFECTDAEIIHKVKPMFVALIGSASSEMYANMKFAVDYCNRYIAMNAEEECKNLTYVRRIEAECLAFLVNETIPMVTMLGFDNTVFWTFNVPDELCKGLKKLRDSIQPIILPFEGPFEMWVPFHVTNKREIIESIGHGNLDLLHGIIVGNNALLKTYLLTFDSEFCFPWTKEEDQRNGAVMMSEKTVVFTMFYLLYAVGHLEHFCKDEPFLVVFVKFLTILFMRDDLKLTSLKRKGREQKVILKKYFLVGKSKQNMFYYFHALFLKKVGNLSFVKDHLMMIYRMFAESESLEVSEKLKENKMYFAEIPKHVANKEELEELALQISNELYFKVEKKACELDFEGLKKMLSKTRGEISEYYKLVENAEIVLIKDMWKSVYGEVRSAYLGGDKVSVKVFSEKSVNFKSEHFLEDVALLNVLKHPNVISIFGTTMNLRKDDMSTFFVVTEPIKTNIELLTKSMKLDEKTAYEIIVSIVNGMQYLHELNILHGNLNPNNIVMTTDECVKITDFEMCFYFNISKASMKDGPHRWMSPERLMFKNFEKEMDVYSFSLVAWQIFTSKTPFESYTKIGEFKKAVCEKNERPDINEVPTWAQSFVKKGWNKSQNRRPTFSKIAKELSLIHVD
ncbi:serine-threonine protein kinase, putative [Entamoeba invadens IP1]|uniref:Serine-threonine protein kinase, putative n=1 Tax=Entamoeba invadens IP1 TaxID=370355 RepID=A0A0A1UGL9_ENTIV|nr:serine-threonine protein kinase, putative [Entamoeba invadens IP1]ELP92802.1 serine-threonine protein kinase, putative [Entamoeba invadens IP1]|eukprot:XP_004259573.1 serine-threonine protein kinase, putative [Entamoeba invadens IP1]